MNKIIELKGVKKTYNKGMPNEVRVLKGINLTVMRGDFITIVGPSGSGKTTLLDIIGCLLKPDEGCVWIDGKDVSKLDDDQLAKIRKEKLGFVFQEYNLIRTFTPVENVELALRIAGKSKKMAIEEAKKLLDMVGLGHRMNHMSGLLSGGEQQRVAIARALANQPKIILADEPTGNLDTKTGKQILTLLEWLNIEKGYTFVVVTHDPEITRYANRVVYLKDGTIIKEIVKKDHKIVKLDKVIK
ncbi:MAG: ABC transporter ATP-binding protein [Candidatus Aenigmatarchaeota archaeon]